MGDAGAFWDKRADKYAQQPIRHPERYEHTLDAVRKQLSATDRVLEVGCGTGTTALLLAPDVAEIVATDASTRMVEIGREKAAAQGVENVRFERATLGDEAFPPGPYDVAMGFNFLHLVEDIPAALRRIHALLEPGGLFVSKTVCTAEQTRLWALLLGALRVVGVAPYVRSMTAAELEGLIVDAGFEIVETHPYASTPPTHYVVARRA